MAELTHAEYKQSDVVALERWADIHNHTLYLLDPATGERLSTEQPPVWLASDPRLAEGYQALGDPAREHELTIALSRHKLASDLGRFEHTFTWFERTYARSHAAAFEEAGGWDRVAWEDTLQDLRSRSQLPPGLSRSTRFPDRLLRSTLKHKNVVEFSYDIEKTDKPIDKLLVEMTHPDAPYSRLRRMDFPVKKVLHFAAGALREWYMPGKYMHELLKLDLPNPSSVLFTLGAAHGDVPRKFNTFGFLPTVRHLPLSRRDREEVEAHTQAMRAGRISLEALGKLSLLR